MNRTKRGKRLELTTRDLAIFALLARYRYLRSTYIHAFVGGASETRFKERLGDLFHEGYIDRPQKQWELADCRCKPAIYEIGQGGLKALQDSDAGDAQPRTWLGIHAHRQFLHSLMISEALASLELGVRADPHLRFIAWPEILGRAPAAVRASATPFRIPMSASGYMVPDGLFGVEYKSDGTKAYRFFAVEADRGTMPVERSDRNQTSYLGKIAAYREVIAHQTHKTHWGIPNLLVLTLTTGAPRMTEMLTLLESQTGNGASFLFKSVNSSGLTTPAVRLLIEPWDRPGHPPLRIDQ